jgi:hypothetical protein
MDDNIDIMQHQAEVHAPPGVDQLQQTAADDIEDEQGGVHEVTPSETDTDPEIQLNMTSRPAQEERQVRRQLDDVMLGITEAFTALRRDNRSHFQDIRDEWLQDSREQERRQRETTSELQREQREIASELQREQREACRELRRELEELRREIDNSSRAAEGQRENSTCPPPLPQEQARPKTSGSSSSSAEREPTEQLDRQPLGKLDTYDGTAPWLEYQTYFEEYADFCRWSGPEKARYLCLQLRGGAQSILVGLDTAERRDYDRVVNALRQHFCPAEKVYTYQAELQARRLLPDESLTDLAREIQCKARLAYPEAGITTLESLMRSHFCNSLTNREMKISVSQGHPRTLNQALALAVEYESIIQADESRMAPPQKKTRKSGTDESDARPETTAAAATGVDSLKGVVEQLASLMQNFRQQQHNPTEQPRESPGGRESRRRPRGDRRCFICNKPGHFAVNCWSKSKREPPELNRQQTNDRPADYKQTIDAPVRVEDPKGTEKRNQEGNYQ